MPAPTSDPLPRIISRPLQFQNGCAIGISNRWRQGQYCTILTEAGPDLSRFRNASAVASWLGLCPDKKVSGGKVLYTGSRKGEESHRDRTAAWCTVSLPREELSRGVLPQDEMETWGARRRHSDRTQAGTHRLPLAFHQAAILR